MKKLIQICSILSLLVIFTAVSAQAQSVTQYKAQIPFDFNIGQKSYEAGSYVIKVTKPSIGGITLSLEDNEGNKLQTLLGAENGDVSEKEPELVFNRYDNQRFLTKILTPKSGILVAMTKDERQIAKQQRTKSKTQIALSKSDK